MIKSDKKLNGKWVFSKAKIYDPFKEKYLKGNILINNGKFIELIGNDTPSDASVVDCSKKFITHPFIDLHAHFREPGREDKETLETGITYPDLLQFSSDGKYLAIVALPEEQYLTKSKLNTFAQLYVVELSR